MYIKNLNLYLIIYAATHSPLALIRFRRRNLTNIISKIQGNAHKAIKKFKQ